MCVKHLHFQLLLSNHWADEAEIWAVVSGHLVDVQLLQSGHCPTSGQGGILLKIKVLLLNPLADRFQIWCVAWET